MVKRDAPFKRHSKKKQNRGQKKSFSLSKAIREYICGKTYVPLNSEDLRLKLNLSEKQQPLFETALLELQQEGTIKNSDGKWILNRQENLVRGMLRLHHRGFGFVVPEDAQKHPEDIFIPKHLTNFAVDGDLVDVSLGKQPFSPKGPEGKIAAIVARNRKRVAGTIRQESKEGLFIAFSPLLGTTHPIAITNKGRTPLKLGDRVVLDITDWASNTQSTQAKVVSLIGNIEDPSCDVEAAIEEFQIATTFSEEAIAEALAFGTKVRPKDWKDREDLTDLECFTIDPDTAKDFDDAVSLSIDSKGHYHLAVHIADASYYVAKGSKLDEEAKKRCNSTYFPGHCTPMLPRQLSEHLCSLRPKVNRLAISVIMELDEAGTLIAHRFCRSVIHSRARFTYRQAKEILEGKKRSRFKENLQQMQQLCLLLKKKRFDRGSVEFSLPELVLMVDESGVPYKTEVIEYDITHQMIEEFMLKTNEVVAAHLSQKGKELSYRIHEQPSDENMKDFALLATSFGFNLKENPSPAEIQQLFNEVLHTRFGSYLATSYIRSMKLAIYSPDNIGHFGLRLEHYCHFTSPIRRYVDLVIHRILMGELIDRKEVQDTCERCSELERISEKAENSVIALKKLRFLKKWKEDEPNRQYAAIVTRIKNFGLTFEIVDLMVEGFFHVSQLEGDYFVYQSETKKLVGVHQNITFASGDRIFVHLSEVDLLRMEATWQYIGRDEPDSDEKGTVKKSRERKGSARRRGKSQKQHPVESKSKSRDADQRGEGAERKGSDKNEEKKGARPEKEAVDELEKSTKKQPVKPVKQTAKQTAKQPAKQTAKQTAKPQVNQTAKQPGKQTAKSPAKSEEKNRETKNREPKNREAKREKSGKRRETKEEKANDES